MDFLRTVFAKTLEVSIAMSLVIAVFLLLRTFFGKRYRAKTFYFVWLIIALRLAVPFNFPISHAPISIAYNTVLSKSIAEDDKGVSGTDKNGINKNVTDKTRTDNFRVGKTGADSAAVPALDGGRSAAAIKPNEENISSDGHKEFLILSVWVAGAGVFLTVNLVVYALFCRKVCRWRSKNTDENVMDMFIRLKRETGVWNIDLYICPAVQSPLIMGFIRQSLLLPKEDYTPFELEAVFRHELVHAGRHDLFYKLLLLIVRTIHWFNPMVHLMAYRAEQDLEISCDEAVVEGKTPEFKAGYGYAVLSAADKGLSYSYAPFTSHFNGGKKTMKERMTAVAGKSGRRMGKLMVCFATLLAVFAATACQVGGTVGNVNIGNVFNNYNDSAKGKESELYDVLSGRKNFLYVADGDFITANISEVPALFNAYDDYMAIQSFTLIDLDGDGSEEAILWVCTVAGDMGGYMILHSEGEHVCGYMFNYRTLWNLKTDGTFDYSDNAGAKEGVASISFTDGGFAVNELMSATGREYVMDTFVINGMRVAEDEYNAAIEMQNKKSDAEWRDFSDFFAAEGDTTDKTPRSGELGIDFAAYDTILTSEDYAELSRFFPVLLNGQAFYAGYAPSEGEIWKSEEITLESFRRESESMSMYDEPPKISSFALCDMNQDGEKELILSFDNDAGTYLVLHQDGDKFQGVIMYVRWIQMLQINGVYHGSNGAATGSYDRMTFENGSVQTMVLAEYDGWDDDQRYWIGGVEVSADEYYKWIEDNCPGDVVWYE